MAGNERGVYNSTQGEAMVDGQGLPVHFISKNNLQKSYENINDRNTRARRDNSVGRHMTYVAVGCNVEGYAGTVSAVDAAVEALELQKG